MDPEMLPLPQVAGGHINWLELAGGAWGVDAEVPPLPVVAGGGTVGSSRTVGPEALSDLAVVPDSY